MNRLGFNRFALSATALGKHVAYFVGLVVMLGLFDALGQLMFNRSPLADLLSFLA
ncbi:MAG: hypothetical protein P4L53_23855 [Candidatus Obscuribacterales bacterium]|nr:hypothetical protein [Candidatus Obscuribacterales bacterium]